MNNVDADRRAAVIVGALFIVALVLHLVGGMMYGPATGSEDFLENAFSDRTMVTLGVLVEFVAVMAIPLIGYFVFPVLRRFNLALAMAYAGFRTVEVVFLVANQGKILSLIDLSEDHQSGANRGSDLQAIGDSLLAQIAGTFNLYVLVFTTGALIFYTMLYRARLVPRWLSIWGFAAAAVMMAGTVLFMLGVFSEDSDSIAQAIAIIPIPLNELALATWLIVKGFNGQSNELSNDPSDNQPNDQSEVTAGHDQRTPTEASG